MDFKHVQNISEAGVATILLYDGIGPYVNGNGESCPGIDGAEFAAEIEYLQDKCSQINVRINSFGGSVYQGYSIISAIQNSKVPVHTFCDGLCASIAGVILLSGEHISIKQYGTIMLHNPHGGADEKMLEVIKNTLVTLLSNNTHFTPEQVIEVMDKETWYDAKQAFTAGLVDVIIPSNKKPKVDTSSLYAMAMCYNSLITPKQNQMIKVKNQLGLEETVNEEAVVKTIAELQEEIKTLQADKLAVETSKEVLAARLAQIEKEKEEAKLLEVTEMVNSFVTGGKIKAEEANKYIKLAQVDFDTVKNTLSKIGNTEAAKIMNTVSVSAPAKDERADWTHIDYEKKDPDALQNIYRTNPELANKLFSESYK